MKTTRTVLIRAHGEPPGTYENALRYGIALIDATCPVVARLQKTVARAHVAMSRVGGQVVIFGRRGHAEVRGLAGQAGGDVLVVENEADLDSLDFTRPIYFLAQTTSSLSEFRRLGGLIKQRAASGGIAEPVGRASIPPLGQVKSVRAVLAAPSFFGDTATSPIPGHCAAGEESANRRSLGVSERGDVNFSHRHREDDVVQGDADSETKAAPPAAAVTVHDTICRQVSGREEHLAGFARRFDVVLFVSGAKSSNGRVLFEAVRAANPRSHKIENASELRPEWFDGGRRAGGGSGLREISVGVCGATSTPRWLMEHVAGEVEKIAR